MIIKKVLNKMTSRKLGAILILIIITTCVFAVSFNSKTYLSKELEVKPKDSIASVRAFMKVYAVLQHPRCMNCHPAGDIPLQGDESRLHAMLPKRGLDGKGVYAMKCSNCHQPTNTPGLHTPPGNPNWHLPPADMKMIFEGRSPRELAKQLLDPTTNSHKTHEQLIEHVSFDKLVIGSWDPGEGRTLPPISHKDFVTNFKTWLETGAYLPSKDIKTSKK